jgi:hypothetical protein
MLGLSIYCIWVQLYIRWIVLCCEFLKCFFVGWLRSSVQFVSLLLIKSIAYLRCIVSCCEFDVKCFLVGRLKSSVRSISLLHIRWVVYKLHYLMLWIFYMFPYWWIKLKCQVCLFVAYKSSCIQGVLFCVVIFSCVSLLVIWNQMLVLSICCI